jgi:ribulose-phosphate 3-epimerase
VGNCDSAISCATKQQISKLFNQSLDFLTIPLYHIPLMNQTIKIAPSILAADFAHLAEEIHSAEAAGADYIHVDVMDGHFVPNITIGPPVVRCIRQVTDLPLDVHLMISDPIKYIPVFADAGADGLTIHVEATPHLHRALEQIRDLGVRPGVTLTPSTPASAISEVLHDVDLVLVMTVNPGFGGQTLIEHTLYKIARIREMIEGSGRAVELEVDGGVDPTTAERLVAAGATVLVAGTAIFRSDSDVAAAIEAIRESAHRGRKTRFASKQKRGPHF